MNHQQCTPAAKEVKIIFLSLFVTLLVIVKTFAPAQEISGSTPPLPSGRPVPAIVQQWADAWNTGDAHGELFTEDGIYQDFAFQAKSQGKKA